MVFNNHSNTSDIGEETELYEAIQCYSVLVWRIYFTHSQNLIVSACMGLTVLPIVALNFALGFGLYKVGCWRKKSKFFIFMLAISDVLFGLSTVPSNVILVSLLSDQRICWFERGFLFVAQTNGHFSFYSVMAIALERYLNITAALRFGVERGGIIGKLTRLTSTTQGHRICFTTMLLLSILHGFVPTYFFGTVQSNIPNIVMVFLRFAVLASIYTLYIRMYMALKKHVRESQQLNSKHNKVFRTVITILIVYTVCYMPAALTDFAASYYTYVGKRAAPNTLRFFNYLSYTLIYLNAAINAGVLLQANGRALAYNFKLLSGIFPCFNLEAEESMI